MQGDMRGGFGLQDEGRDRVCGPALDILNRGGSLIYRTMCTSQSEICGKSSISTSTITWMTM